MSIDEIVAHNSHELTAHLLITERADRAAERERHNADLAQLKSTLARAHRIGIHALELNRKGRKTVRLADLIEEES